jgi:ABC-type lipoprotein release transport system permease subunit
MAWRNIWRNKRRTLITAASIFFAVFFAVIMRSMQLGTYGNMIDQSIEKFSGYLQLQNPEYFDEPNLDNFIENSDKIIAQMNETSGIRIAVPRIESFVLASTGHQSKGVLVTGIDPEQELQVSNPEYMLAKYKLTPEIVEQILPELNFEKTQIELLKYNANKLYHDLDRLALDLALNPDEFAPYHSLFDKYASHKGKYLKKDDDGVLVSSRLATFLRAQVGDSIILLGQGRYGSTAAGLFPIRGIVKVPSPELDNKLVYMSLTKAQEFFDMPNMITTVVMNLDNKDDMLSMQDKLNRSIDGQNFVVKNWEEINPTLKQQIDGDNKGGQMFLVILYFIIFFGIVGTVMMMIAERKREFGVLVAIGMKKRLLASIVLIEMVFIGFIGTISGMLATLPLVYFLNTNPIRVTGEASKMYEDMGIDAVMPAAAVGDYFTWQGIIILLMVVIACSIPLRRIRKMKIMDALRA